MKLDKFFEKPKIAVANNRSPLIVQNESKISQLEELIKTLEQQLVDQTTLLSERDAAVNRQIAVEESRREVQLELDKVKDVVKLHETDIEYYIKELERISPLEESVRTQTSRADALQNDVMNHIEQTAKLKNDLDRVTNQVEGLLVENAALTASEAKATSHQVSILEDFKGLKNQFERIKTFSDDNSKIKQDLEKEVYQLRDNRNYWQKEADEAKIQVEQTAIIEDRLRNWITKLEKDGNTSRKKSSAATSIVNDLKNTVSEMGDTIDELMKERNYLQKVNAEYRKELTQPRYLSMGSIMAREKFSMPLAKENIRTQYLGNSPPTLLKFKKKSGESNDN